MHRWLFVVALALASCIARPPALLAAQDADDTSNVTITTVPAVAGYPVTVDGREYLTDESGTVVIELTVADHAVSVPEILTIDESTRYVFRRWNDIWEADRTVTVGRRAVMLQLGLLVQNHVRFSYLDALGDPINDPTRIQSVVMLNSNGDRLQLSNEEGEEGESYDAASLHSAWLTANRLRRIGIGLVSDDNVHVFRQVYVDGHNVIQSGLDELIPERGASWEIRLLLFDIDVELRSFVFGEAVDGTMEVRSLYDETSTPPLFTAETGADGVATIRQLARGDYQIAVSGGGFSTVTPAIVTGPKVERITVVTRSIYKVLIPIVLLVLASVVAFVLRPHWRIGLAATWLAVVGFLLSVPSIGAALSRPLSATARPVYTESGAFLAIQTFVNNSAPISIQQTYCAPDFELRLITDEGVWQATYESHDFHDVELDKVCRIHVVSPGRNENIFSPTAEQEWVTVGELPKPGIYQAYVRVFAVPAELITLDLRHGFSPLLSFAPPEREEPVEVPFTNPFED